jgi:hypothetical protein
MESSGDSKWIHYCAELTKKCFQTTTMQVASGQLPFFFLNPTNLSVDDFRGIVTFRDAGNFDLCLELDDAHFCGIGFAWGKPINM